MLNIIIVYTNQWDSDIVFPLGGVQISEVLPQCIGDKQDLTIVFAIDKMRCSESRPEVCSH